MAIHHPDRQPTGASEIARFIRRALNYTDSLSIGPNEYGLNVAFLRGNQIDMLARVEDRPNEIFGKNGQEHRNARGYFSTAPVLINCFSPLKPPFSEGLRLALFVRFSDRILRRVPLLWCGFSLAPNGSMTRSYEWKDFETMSETSGG